MAALQYYDNKFLQSLYCGSELARARSIGELFFVGTLSLSLAI